MYEQSEFNSILDYKLLFTFLSFRYLISCAPTPREPRGSICRIQELESREPFQSFWLARQGYLVARAMVKDPR